MPETFTKRSHIAAPADVVFAWHERPDAFEVLTPPWESVRVVKREGEGVRAGTRITLETRLGPLRLRWEALHTESEPGRMFRDEQVRGPFAHWVHTHRMIPDGDAACILEDHVEYALPGGALGQILGGWFVRRKLARLFEWRHRVTREQVEGRARE